MKTIYFKYLAVSVYLDTFRVWDWAFFRGRDEKRNMNILKLPTTKIEVKINKI